MKNIIPLFLLLMPQFIGAQKKGAVLKTNTASIHIQEGNFKYNDIWTVSPEVKPDIFVTNPFVGTQRITFYSDIDSISFNVKPNKKYNFIILQQGKDTAYTQINTNPKEKPSLEPPLFYTRFKKKKGATDTIPFKLGADNRIHLKGKVNGSDTLDFLFDTGAGACVITSALIPHKVNLILDGNQENMGSDGKSMVEKSGNNTMEIQGLVWKKVSLLSIPYKNPSFDMVLGWVAFENKIVEIDYEKNILVLHPTLPRISPEYSPLELKLIGGIPYIKCKLIVHNKEYEGWFDLDTGSDGDLFMGQKFAKSNSLNGALKGIRTSTSTGSAGKEILADEVLLPQLKLGDYEMYQVPLAIQRQEIEGVTHNENIGNNILKRFNTFIDFKNNLIYIKPNPLFYLHR